MLGMSGPRSRVGLVKQVSSCLLPPAFDAILESLPGAMQQQFDGPLAAMQLLADLGQFLFAAIMQFESLPGARAKTVHAAWQVPDRIIVVRPKSLGRQNRFEFQAQLRPSHFLATLQALDVLAQQVAGDPQQPRSDKGRGIEAGLRDVEPQKHFLSHVVGITDLQEPRPQITKNRALMPFDDRREGRTVSATKLLDQSLVDGQQQARGPDGGGVKSGRSSRGRQMVRPATNQTQPRRIKHPLEPPPDL